MEGTYQKKGQTLRQQNFLITSVEGTINGKKLRRTTDIGTYNTGGLQEIGRTGEHQIR